MRFIVAIFLSLALPAAHCAAQTWETVKPDGLGVSVEFPGKPEYTEMKDDLGDGTSGLIRTYVVKSSAAAYDVTIYDLPKEGVGPDDIDRVLDNMRDRTIAGVSGELRAETKIEMGGHKARELTADVMGIVWRSKIVIANNKLYQIVAIVSKAAERSETTEKYMGSFNLLEGSSSGPKK